MKVEDVIKCPAGFARGVLGMELYPKQKAALEALAPAGARVSFRSCNEGGKTKRVIVGAILWHLTCFPKGHVVSTSGAFRQIKDQLLPALHCYRGRFPRWKFLQTPRIETDSLQCFWEGFSTNDAGKFEGHHSEGNEKPLLMIVDEAKTVKDGIFEAVERCKPTRLLIASSPGYAEGEFYRSHTTHARFWKTVKQTAQECPHWRDDEIQRLREKWGPQHPLVRSMVDAEFMEMVQDAIIDLRALENLLADPPLVRRQGERKAFCDFAWSGEGDENVLAFRDGNVVTLEEIFHGDSLHAICGRFVSAFTRLGLKAWEIEGDNGGAGKLIIDQLHAMGWPIARCDNGGPPRFDDHYASVAAEMWFEGALQIERRQVVLPDDNDLRGQLLSRKKKFHPKGLLAIESKRDMKDPNREGGAIPSPDRAEAVLGAMAPLIRVKSTPVFGTPEEHDQFTGGDWLDRIREEIGQPTLPGAFAG